MPVHFFSCHCSIAFVTPTKCDFNLKSILQQLNYRFSILHHNCSLSLPNAHTHTHTYRAKIFLLHRTNPCDKSPRSQKYTWMDWNNTYVIVIEGNGIDFAKSKEKNETRKLCFFYSTFVRHLHWLKNELQINHFRFSNMVKLSDSIYHQ